MVKRKIEVNYRRANERFKRCKYCTHKKWTSIYNCRNQSLRYDWRCEIVGIQSPRRYGIQDDHVCDHHAGNGGLHG